MLIKSEHLFEFDKKYKKTIIGTDEAGRGPGAGGVFAAAVCFPDVTNGLMKDLEILNDSKKLTPKKRNSIYGLIKSATINEIVCIEVEEIENINILNASLKAMQIACNSVIKKIYGINTGENLTLSQTSDKIGVEKILTLVDGNKLIKNYAYPQEFVIKGDSKSASIAAASILAKVTRDRYMEELDKQYPQYNWRKNAGYLTAEHLKAIDKYGLTPYHRPSFLKKHFASEAK